jgi:C-terminal processing protease CtpA/Prc
VTRAFARGIVGFGLGLGLGLGACAASKGTIGAVLAREADGRLFVHEVPTGLGADEAGLETGDEILLIDGRDARALGPRGVHEALSGTVGETVKLTLVRKGQVVRVTVKRTLARRHALSPEAAPAGP